MVLFRIENFEQRRARVAAKIRAELVDFVEQQHRIDCARLLHHLNDLAGQRADVGATMTANFRFVAHAAKRQTHKLAAGGARNRFTQTGFADSRRADKAENRTLRILHQLPHGEILENAFLDLLQTVVIFVENLFSLGQILDLFGLLFPGHAHQPVDVGARNSAFGRHRRHRFQPMQFLHRFLLGLFGHADFFNLLLQLLEFGLLVLAAQFFVNRLDLLVEVILFLRLLHLTLHASLNRAIELALFNFQLKQFNQPLQARLRRKQFQQALLVFD